MTLLPSTILKLCRRARLEIKSARTLFTAESLGLDRYEEQRERSAIQYSGGVLIEKFKSRVRDTVASDNQTVYVDDLKSFLHLASGSQEDVDAVVKLCKKYQSQGKGVRFGNFTIGPVIMRYFHVFGRPVEALQVFTDPASEGMFHQFSTFRVLMDLLYEKGMYNELLAVFDIVKGLKVGGYSYHSDCTTLALAACYKLNTPESYERAKQISKEVQDAGGVLKRRSLIYVGALAIKQNDPLTTLDILTRDTSLYYSVVSLKILALCKLNRPEDSFPLLRKVLGQEDQQKKTKLCSEVFEELKKSVNNVGDTVLQSELEKEFAKIEKAMREANRITEEKLEDLLMTPIRTRTLDGPQQSWNSALRGAAFSRNKRDTQSRRYEDGDE